MLPCSRADAPGPERGCRRTEGACAVRRKAPHVVAQERPLGVWRAPVGTSLDACDHVAERRVLADSTVSAHGAFPFLSRARPPE